MKNKLFSSQDLKKRIIPLVMAMVTLLSRGVGAARMVGLGMQKKNPVHMRLKDLFSFQYDLLRKILKVALPSSIEMASLHVSRIILLGAIATVGTTQIGA